MNIVFLDRDTIGPEVIFPKPDFNHQWTQYPQTRGCDIAIRLKNCNIAITNKVVIDKAVLQACPQLKYIAVAATGTNNVDLDECQIRGITVANVTDYATSGVAEHVFMLILALRKQLKAYSQALEKHQWQTSGQFCFFLNNGLGIQTLNGQTLGLVGTGNIARATAKIASAFGISVVFHSPSGRKSVDGKDCVPLNELLDQADIVSIHCPLTDQTKNLISNSALSAMKSDALLINTARGPIVDFDALEYAINHGVIGGAGLDVLEKEPPDIDSAEMRALTNPRLIITPHTAWASQYSMQTMANQLIKKMNSFVMGSRV